MLDPDLHQQEHAAAASKQGGAGSSSSPSEVPFSDGLVQDTITLLHMLHEAQALADSPLQLALQVCWEHSDRLYGYHASSISRLCIMLFHRCLLSAEAQLLLLCCGSVSVLQACCHFHAVWVPRENLLSLWPVCTAAWPGIAWVWPLHCWGLACILLPNKPQRLSYMRQLITSPSIHALAQFSAVRPASMVVVVACVYCRCTATR